ncbi:hypothetical protein CPT_Moonbeam219 [Bacillus phage Moonbeam]|uniref:Uncharacterized protein n=1 Tax=Bacillus phage Moonbeam TaxID=1540091 RepID=A0A0A0RNM2_9CAUD|nr:hypothetical protein CPT_Moonbeam219 [Bacillus phage Moonbeam]AIW03617.1 hypothetical protein CPT_Moonbeam219 [Bacillus phage Moonbeam]
MSLMLFIQIALTVIALSGVALIISMVFLTRSINRLNRATLRNLDTVERMRRNGAV